MAITFNCSQCGSTFKVPEQYAGKRATCKKCGTKLQVPMESVESDISLEPVAENTKTAGPAQPAAQSLQAMKCESCGGNVQYRNGQGYFECKYCHSKYNSVSDNQGNSVVQTIELLKKMEGIEGELQVKRLQENAGVVQDKIDYKYVEFYHSFGRKAGSIAVLCWIIGGVLLLFGLFGGSFTLAGIGIVVALIGFPLFFLVFKKAQAAMQAECEQIRAGELEPIYERLRKVGATLAGGDVALGYTESTTIPLRHCVNCHQNVTPKKERGGLGGALTGINLYLTIITCGMWLPAWIFIAIITKAGSSARRAISSGACPQCGTTPLFPARIKSL